MRLRGLLLILMIGGVSSRAAADAVIDASKEWKAHASTATLPSISSGSAISAVSVAESTEPLSCECDVLTPQEHLDESTYAFTGMVEDVQKPKDGKRVVVFDVDEVFKGAPASDMKVEADVDGNDCDLPYEIGQSYLVFTKWQWGSVVTSRCMGTKFLAKAKTSVLGPSEELKEKLYIHLRDACMGRNDTSCCLSSLKAMREGYYIPEPEEGCPEGAIPDRLHCGGSYTWCIPILEKSHR